MSSKQEEANQKKEQFEKNLLEKFEELSKQMVQNADNTLQNFQKLFEVSSEKVAKSEQEETKLKFTRLFQQLLPNNNQKVNTFQQDVLDKLSEKQQVDFFDYLNKSFEMVGEGLEVKAHPNHLLVFHQQLIQAAGQTVILKNISRKKTLINRYDNDLAKQAI